MSDRIILAEAIDCHKKLVSEARRELDKAKQSLESAIKHLSICQDNKAAFMRYCKEKESA